MHDVDLFKAEFSNGHVETFAVIDGTNFADAVASIIYDRMRRKLEPEIVSCTRWGVARSQGTP